ncbi:MAG: hypothetical protein AAF685_04480 [Cyanobacteria bacterium P01_C01_bin.89]
MADTDLTEVKDIKMKRLTKRLRVMETLTVKAQSAFKSATRGQ